MGAIGAGSHSGILLKERDIRDIKDERDRHRNAEFLMAAYVAFKAVLPKWLQRFAVA